ncbi:MAG TPA: extracellular solute-binding protein [Longilinea sp.]|nr:extracellular solute-binding protein [Longilinea sp.]
MNEFLPAPSPTHSTGREAPNRILTILIALMLILLLVKCSGGMSYPAATATPSASASGVVTEGGVTPESTPNSNQQLITLWLPPEFDPANGSAAGEILTNRLAAFEQLYPGVEVQVRIKSLDGAGGLLGSLAVTSAAAPQALPSLIALPRAAVEEAALRELIQPVNILSGIMDDPDWYPFAVQLATIQNVTYGIPFTGDMQVLAYQSAAQGSLQNWDTILELNRPIYFAAADTQPNFTLSLYISAGGLLQDDMGRPMLEEAPLTSVFQFYNQGAALGVFPSTVIGLQNEGQVWDLLSRSPDAFGIVSASSVINRNSADWHVAALPSLGTQPAAIADGWVFCLTETDFSLQPLAMRLAEFLVDSEFLAQWNEASGYLSPRPAALAAWQQDGMFTLFDPILSGAQATPSLYVLSAYGQNLATATRQVLQFQTSPQEAAQSLLNQLEVP